ncbi:hypothetical protein SLA2020_387900 [Shorea laevis]
MIAVGGLAIPTRKRGRDGEIEASRLGSGGNWKSKRAYPRQYGGKGNRFVWCSRVRGVEENKDKEPLSTGGGQLSCRARGRSELGTLGGVGKSRTLWSESLWGEPGKGRKTRGKEATAWEGITGGQKRRGA